MVVSNCETNEKAGYSEFIVFDLDGTLLDGKSRVSEHTRETLRQLHRSGIAYTVATGRTLHGTRDLLQGHRFNLPHIYKNGVMIWQPQSDRFSHSNLLTHSEIRHVLAAFKNAAVTPFIFTLEPGNQHVVYHPTLQSGAERRLASLFAEERGMALLPMVKLPADAGITNISALGSQQAIDSVALLVRGEDHLVAYAGKALEGEDLCWIDVHHSASSKGNAIATLKQELGFSKVICFGDSDNDLSMFAMADESYAPSNAKTDVKAAATAVIGHHDEDGISRFLRDRFNL